MGENDLVDGGDKKKKKKFGGKLFGKKNKKDAIERSGTMMPGDYSQSVRLADNDTDALASTDLDEYLNQDNTLRS